jgi:hypothetical protein
LLQEIVFQKDSGLNWISKGDEKPGPVIHGSERDSMPEVRPGRAGERGPGKGGHVYPVSHEISHGEVCGSDPRATCQTSEVQEHANSKELRTAWRGVPRA